MKNASRNEDFGSNTECIQMMYGCVSTLRCWCLDERYVARVRVLFLPAKKMIGRDF
jgi:hypothetical protein